MIKINIVCVGSLKEKYLVEASNEYLKRLSKWCKINIVELKQCIVDNPVIAKKQERDLIMAQMSGFVIVMNVHSKQFESSEAFAQFLDNKISSGISEFTFVIGGSYGFHEDIIKKADFLWSFSNLTFPHQLFRVCLLEQIYRALTINNNITYHK